MRTFGLIGKSLRHSFSPDYFARKFAQLGLTDCRYELFELPEITDFPALRTSRQLTGLNVTIPYKEAVIPYLDELAPSALLVGAVNVIAFHDERLIGHNTDLVGFRESLQRFYPVEIADGPALVLGTGGASKAVRAVLTERGIPFQLVSRRPVVGELAWDDLTPALIAEHRLIVNTTPLGTYPQLQECPPLPYEALTTHHFLFDLIYNPSETEFLRRGREAGAHTQNGYEMLALQAEAAWAIWLAVSR